MTKSDSKKWNKTNVGAGIVLVWDAMMKLNTNSKLNMSDKKYYYYLNKQNEEDRISNFIIEPLYVSEDINGETSYILKFVSKDQTKVLEIDGDTLAINNSFKKFCLRNGKFNWMGNQKDLDIIVDFIMAYTTKEITTISYAGWNKEENIWLFPSHAYAQGNVYFPNKEGIFEIGSKYYKLDLDKNDEYYIYPHIKTEPSKGQVLQYFNDLKELYSNYLYLAFGYVAGSFHVDAISSKTDYFPFLYVHGKYSQGKSAFVSIISKFSAMKVPLSCPPSLDGLRKGISKKANLPFVIDEAEDKSGDKSRGRDFLKYLSDAIKVIYMRQTLIRGHKDENLVVRYPTRGTLFLSGEVLTSVASIIQRSILIDSSKIIKNEEVFNRVRRSEVPIWIAQFLMRTLAEWQNDVLTLYDEITDYFNKKGWTNIDIRIRSNYAIFLAGAFAGLKQLNNYFGENLFLNSKEELKDIYLFIYKEMVETQRMTEDDHPSMKFLAKIGLLANKNVLRENIDYRFVKQDDGNVILYLAPTNIMEAYKNHEKNPFYSTSHKAVKDIQNQHYFLGTKKIRIGKSQPTAWAIQLTNPQNPELINDGIIHPDLPDTMIYFYR